MSFELEPPDEETAAHLRTIQSTPSMAPADPKYVRFYTRSERNREKSAAAGRPVFEPVECIEILCPGDKDAIVDRQVRNIDRYVWAEKYRAFRNGAQESLSGTPLSAWAGVPPERVDEYAYFKIRTVEQLADIPDGNLQRLGIGARAEREKAKAYLAVMAGNAPLLEMKAENDRLKERLDALERLAAQTDSDPDKPRRGRPPKQPNEQPET